MQTDWTWSPFVWAVVVGYNPENADMDNPRGEIIRDRFFPCAEAPDGSRYVSWQQPFEVEDECAALCTFYNDVNAQPNPARDAVEQPAYGSVAYQRGGWEQMYAEQDREDCW